MLLSNERSSVLDLLPVDTAFEHKIRPDDKLSLSVWNHNDLSMGSVFSIYNSNESFGKWVLVDAQGYAQLPGIGSVKVAELTCAEAAGKLKTILAKEIVDPVVVVKVLNRKVTILGEVRSPGSYVLDEERSSVAEVIGKAQGLTDYADARCIRLVRDSNSYDLNLHRMSDQLLHNITVRADDLIIVSSKPGKAIDLKAPTLIPFASTLTAIAIVLSLIN